VVARLASRVGDDPPKICSADAQSALVKFGESLAGEKSRGQSGVCGAESFEKFADQAQLLQLFRSGADRVGDLNEATHKQLFGGIPLPSKRARRAATGGRAGTQAQESDAEVMGFY
jgi:hypothetical protein